MNGQLAHPDRRGASVALLDWDALQDHRDELGDGRNGGQHLGDLEPVARQAGEALRHQHVLAGVGAVALRVDRATVALVC